MIRAVLDRKRYTMKMEVDKLSEQEKIRLTSFSTKAG
jgi:hypothetical protein